MTTVGDSPFGPDPTRGPRYVCRVCKTVLDESVSPLGVHVFRHGPAATTNTKVPTDHEIDAVPETELAPNEVCDFCFELEPEFEIPAKTFAYTMLPGQVSVGNWTACATCAGLIAADSWDQLYARAASHYEALNGPMEAPVRLVLRRMYRQLQGAVTGKPRRNPAYHE